MRQRLAQRRSQIAETGEDELAVDQMELYSPRTKNMSIS
jgi:hypothetical protein